MNRVEGWLLLTMTVRRWIVACVILSVVFGFLGYEYAYHEMRSNVHEAIDRFGDALQKNRERNMRDRAERDSRLK